MNMTSDLVVFSGNSNIPLAEEVCHHLEVPLGKSIVKRFSDGEVWVKIEENVRGKDHIDTASTLNNIGLVKKNQ